MWPRFHISTSYFLTFVVSARTRRRGPLIHNCSPHLTFAVAVLQLQQTSSASRRLNLTNVKCGSPGVPGPGPQFCTSLEDSLSLSVHSECHARPRQPDREQSPRTRVCAWRTAGRLAFACFASAREITDPRRPPQPLGASASQDRGDARKERGGRQRGRERERTRRSDD
jgi:hypothetical protein